MNNLKMAVLAVGLTLVSCMTAAPQAREGGIKPPFDTAMIRARAGEPDHRTFQCATPPEALHDLQMESIYGSLSSNSSVVDPEAYDAYIEGIAPISRYQKGLISMANRYMQSNPPRPEIAACTLK